jgi:hypothetical protein
LCSILITGKTPTPSALIRPAVANQVQVVSRASRQGQRAAQGREIVRRDYPERDLEAARARSSTSPQTHQQRQFSPAGKSRRFSMSFVAE